MKSKGGGLFGIFKKKTTPAPAAPQPVENSTETVNASSSSNSTDSGLEHVEMDVALVQPPPRKGSIATTNVIHYSPPGTVRTSPKSTAPSSLVSADNSLEDNENAVVITRKSNIVLDDEESVISTPISQYDESPIVHKSRKKRTAPPPPPPVQTTVPLTSPVTPSSSSNHYRQTSEVSRTSSESTPPTLPPHRNQNKNEESADYEDMLKKLQTKFDEWHQVRIEDGGSVREERIKAELLKEHLKLKVLLEKEINPKSTATPTVTNNNNNNNNYVKLAPKSVSGGTVYQKTAQQIRPSRTDENKNDIVYSSKNSAAVDRLRKEVEEQRQREREVKQYRNPKTMSPSPKSPDPSPSSGLQSPKSPSSPGPRMVEYKPMKSRDVDVPPPIPKTPPPKLSEYRKESPRMPTVPQNGYVRLQVGKKTVAPTVPQPEPVVPKKIYSPVPYTGPEYASSPKLLRKNQNPVVTPEPLRPQASVPVKEKEIVYQKPQQHPQMMTQNLNLEQKPSESPIYQKKTRVTVNAESTYQKIQKPPVTPMSPPLIRSTIQRAVSQDVPTSESSYKKIQKPMSPPPVRETYQKPPVTPKSPPPVRTTAPLKMMQRAVSQDAKPNNFIYQKSSEAPTSPRPVRSTVFPPKGTPGPPPPILSATSPVYQKITVIPVSPEPVRKVEPRGIPTATSSKPKGPLPKDPKASPTETFDISDVLKGPRLKKVGLPVEKSGISLGKVLDSAAPSSRPSTVPPPPPPPPPPMPMPKAQNSGGPTQKSDLRDSLMSEIREAGRLRAARVSQNA